MKSLASVFAAAAILGAADLASAGDMVEIEEWTVPYENSRPRDPFAHSPTSVWFVGQRTGYLANLNVETGDMLKIDLKEGSGPHNLIVGSDGVVWYAGNRTALIGRYDPVSDEIEEIPMPDPAARDPHTLIFDEAEENIWFTLQGANMMGRMNIETRKVDLIASQTERSRPYGIKLAPDGSIWVALFGTSKLARINPETFELKEIELPRESARPRRLEVLADGTVWYVDYAGGLLGKYNPSSEKFTEWAMPQGEDARPYGMASDSSGRVWMVASGPNPNVFMGFDPATEEFFSQTEVPSGGGTIRHMHYYEPTGEVWFGTDTNYVGRAIVEPKTEAASE
ncbi:MAG: lyase [Pseudomonadota bacterium]